MIRVVTIMKMMVIQHLNKKILRTTTRAMKLPKVLTGESETDDEGENEYYLGKDKITK